MAVVMVQEGIEARIEETIDERISLKMCLCWRRKVKINEKRLYTL